jgi:membrane protein DedA with SNARE-associated domain
MRWRTLLVIITTLAVPVVPFVAIGELPGERWLSAADDDALMFGALGAGLLAADVLLPIPSSIVGTLLGARLGFTVGFLAAFLGLTIGHLLGYAVGRATLTRVGAQLPQAPTLLAVLVSRPVPILAEAMTLTAGAARAPFVPFVAATAIGDACYAAALAASGAAWVPSSWAAPWLLVPVGVPAIGWLLWRARQRRDERRLRVDGRV